MHTPDMRYQASRDMLTRALRTVPLGSQTFSKSKTQYPAGVSPHFIVRGKGGHVWDVDGNEYIDFVNSLAAITLGYGDPDVDAAVRAQLENGVTFSLPHPLEVQVAEKISSLVPCAEMVRFGKNGSDATAGAVRVSRARTGRDHVLVCGYHGWQDWYIGSTARNKGVPQATRDLTHVFPYNDMSALDALFRKLPGQVACVIMEPMNVEEPHPGYLAEVRDLTHRNGAFLVFDETVTGFRYAKGGAQELFGVTPDLATFGKGLANGFPVSAVVGKTDLMREMEEVFFSFTFGGETLSLAAALATLEKLEREPVIETLWTRGRRITEGCRSLIEKHGLSISLAVGGKDCWSFLLFRDAGDCTQWDLKTLFLQEIFSRGILALGGHNMCYAHSDADVDRLLVVYDEVFGLLGTALRKGSVQGLLRTDPLVPLFKIR